MTASFLLYNALSNVYCFPVYTYLILQILSIGVQMLFLSLHQKVQNAITRSNNENDTDSKDHPVVISLINKNKRMTTKHFIDYTPLPKYIINIIIDEYYYDSDEKKLWCKELHKQKKTLTNYYNIYVMAANICYLVCSVLIIWINTEWIINNDFDSWVGFTSLSLTMLIAHPASKIITPIMFATNDDVSKIPFRFLMFNGALVAMFDFAGYLIFGVPSIFYYIPLWILYSGVIFGLVWCTDHLISDDSIIVMIIVFMVYGFVMYGTLVFGMSSMSCVYSKQIRGDEVWYLCLYQSFKSPHCPNTDFMYIDWRNWKAIILFFSWLLF
eukprot:278974_1